MFHRGKSTVDCVHSAIHGTPECYASVNPLIRFEWNRRMRLLLLPLLLFLT